MWVYFFFSTIYSFSFGSCVCFFGRNWLKQRKDDAISEFELQKEKNQNGNHTKAWEQNAQATHTHTIFIFLLVHWYSRVCTYSRHCSICVIKQFFKRTFEKFWWKCISTHDFLSKKNNNKKLRTNHNSSTYCNDFLSVYTMCRGMQNVSIKCVWMF